jgi:hypothetical protein
MKVEEGLFGKQKGISRRWGKKRGSWGIVNLI